MKSIMQYAAVLLSAVMVLSMTCCSNGSGQSDAASVPYEVSSAAEKDGFRFTDYQGDEIIDIQKVENGENLDSVCETYRFIFLSEGDEPYKIKGYISIPLSCVEARQPCQCITTLRLVNKRERIHSGPPLPFLPSTRPVDVLRASGS